MSWSLTIYEVPADEKIAEAIVARAEETLPEPIGTATRDQVATAAEIAALIVASGSIGKAAKVMVSCNGHANPDHVKTEGWSNDAIAVSVSVTEYAEPAE